MARTIYLKNGETEYIFREGTEEECLLKLITEHLGDDCAELFNEVVDPEYIEGDDYERIADGYLSMLQETLSELDEVLAQFDEQRPRAVLRRRIQRIRDNLYKNV